MGSSEKRIVEACRRCVWWGRDRRRNGSRAWTDFTLGSDVQGSHFLCQRSSRRSSSVFTTQGAQYTDNGAYHNFTNLYLEDKGQTQ